MITIRESPRERTEKIKQYIVEDRTCVADGIQVSYQLHNSQDPTDEVWIDEQGNIYISTLPDAPEEYRKQFADLIALHERLEYDWLDEQGLPKPRYNVEPQSREADIAREIHNQVHYLELTAAKNMGILDEFVKWRPSETVTEEFYRKLKQEAP